MKPIKCSLMRGKDNNMMRIEKVDLVQDDLILEDLAEVALNLILVILEICSEECLDEASEVLDREEKPEEMIWRGILKLALKRRFWELLRSLPIREKCLLNERFRHPARIVMEQEE